MDRSDCGSSPGYLHDCASPLSSTSVYIIPAVPDCLQQHEIETPTDIPIFLSFFTIIFWTWCSQTAYDMRFQGDDALHRSFKFLQVILFIYQGASSANWNPGKIEVWAQDAERNAEDYGAKLASHQDAARSWLTVVLAFAVSRGVLAVQYGICKLIVIEREGSKTGQLTDGVANVKAHIKAAEQVGQFDISSSPSTHFAYRSS